jgi:hypothetical protein
MFTGVETNEFEDAETIGLFDECVLRFVTIPRWPDGWLAGFLGRRVKAVIYL